MFPKEISKRLWLELECTEYTGFWSFHHMMISNQQWCLTPHPPFPKCLSGDNTLWNILCTKTPKTQQVLICTQVPHFVSRAFRMAGIVPDHLPHFHLKVCKQHCLSATWQQLAHWKPNLEEHSSITVNSHQETAQQTPASHSHQKLKTHLSHLFLFHLADSLLSLHLMCIPTCWVSPFIKMQQSIDQCTNAQVGENQTESGTSTPAVSCSDPCPYR